VHYQDLWKNKQRKYQQDSYMISCTSTKDGVALYSQQTGRTVGWRGASGPVSLLWLTWITFHLPSEGVSSLQTEYSLERVSQYLLWLLDTYTNTTCSNNRNQYYKATWILPSTKSSKGSATFSAITHSIMMILWWQMVQLVCHVVCSKGFVPGNGSTATKNRS
jgi:hypothetical protein